MSKRVFKTFLSHFISLMMVSGVSIYLVIQELKFMLFDDILLMLRCFLSIFFVGSLILVIAGVVRSVIDNWRYIHKNNDLKPSEHYSEIEMLMFYSCEVCVSFIYLYLSGHFVFVWK